MDLVNSTLRGINHWVFYREFSQCRICHINGYSVHNVSRQSCDLKFISQCIHEEMKGGTAMLMEVLTLDDSTNPGS